MYPIICVNDMFQRAMFRAFMNAVELDLEKVQGLCCNWFFKVPEKKPGKLRYGVIEFKHDGDAVTSIAHTTRIQIASIEKDRTTVEQTEKIDQTVFVKSSLEEAIWTLDPRGWPVSKVVRYFHHGESKVVNSVQTFHYEWDERVGLPTTINGETRELVDDKISLVERCIRTFEVEVDDDDNLLAYCTHNPLKTGDNPDIFRRVEEGMNNE